MANWKKVRHRRRFRKRFSIASDSVKNSRRLVNLARFAFLGVVILFIGSFLILPLMAFNLPSPDKVVRREGFSTKIMYRNGEALYDIFAEQKRNPTELSNIPQDLKNATIAI